MEKKSSKGNYCGWVFYSGLEDEDFAKNDQNFTLLPLNYVCNCDTDIIPFLRAKEGASYCRDIDGRFVDFNDIEIDTEELDTVAYLSSDDIDNIKEHVTKNVGPITHIIEENISDIISVDILVVSPTEKRNYYTLVTMGMSAKRMQVSRDLEREEMERAELVMCVPPHWRIDKLINQNVYQQHNSRWYWPISILKRIARLPFENQMCIGFGQCIPNGSPPKPFTAGTKLSGVILDVPRIDSPNFERMHTKKGGIINFYYANPVYAEEIEFRQRFNVEELLHMLRTTPDFPILNIHRKNVCKKDWFS